MLQQVIHDYNITAHLKLICKATVLVLKSSPDLVTRILLYTIVTLIIFIIIISSFTLLCVPSWLCITVCQEVRQGPHDMT